MALGSVSTSGSYVENKFGVPNGIATLDKSGKLAESQRPEVDAYTRAQTDQKVSAAIGTHNDLENAHPDIRVVMAQLNARLAAIELKFSTNVTKNPFAATFGSLDDLAVTGVWNQELQRIEF